MSIRSKKCVSDERFESFWELLTDKLEELTPEIKPIINTCLTEVYPELCAKALVIKSGAKKPPNCYNVYMKETMPIVKEDKSIEPCRRMTVIGEMWQALGDEGKVDWCVARGLTPPKSKSKKSSDKEDGHSSPKIKGVKLPRVAKSSDSEDGPKGKTPKKLTKVIKKSANTPKVRKPLKKLPKANKASDSDKDKKLNPTLPMAAKASDFASDASDDETQSPLQKSPDGGKNTSVPQLSAVSASDEEDIVDPVSEGELADDE